MFIGYCDDGPSYWLLNLANGKLVRSIHVAFVESQPAHAPAAPPVACGTVVSNTVYVLVANSYCKLL
jgi:hypothetical protein